MARRQLQPDYYALLQLTPRATDDEIGAAYARLQELYSPERMAHAAPEFQEQAARKRQELADAYQTLSQPGQRAAYDRKHGFVASTAPELTDGLDYRPLPPARGQERTGLPPVVTDPPPTRPARTGPAFWLPPLAVGLLLVAVALVIGLSGVRTTGGEAAVPTPALPNVQLPFSPDQLAQLATAAEQSATFEAWVALGNARFDNMQTLRENALFSPQYRGALPDWLAVIEAYDRALALQDEPTVRSDRAVALLSYGLDAPDGQRLAEAVAEAERAVQAEVTAPRALLNYGLILASTTPPRTDEALALWRKVGEVAPETPEAQRAQALLEQYGR